MCHLSQLVGPQEACPSPLHVLVPRSLHFFFLKWLSNQNLLLGACTKFVEVLKTLYNT